MNPVSSMIVRLTSRGYSALQGANGLVAIEPYHPAIKIDPSTVLDTIQAGFLGVAGRGG